MDNLIKRLPPPPFAVRTSGRIESEKFHSTPGTRADDIMLTAFLKGVGIYRHPGGKERILAGMVGLVRPTDGGVLSADPDDPYTHYYCRFGGDYALSLAQEIICTQGGNFFSHPGCLEVANGMRTMGTFFVGDLPDRMGFREELLIRILLKLSAPQTPETMPHLSAETILNYLSEAMAKPTDLDAMASDFDLSKSSLCRIVKKSCGKTVQKLHEELKINWAKTLLESGYFSVAEVAARVGYGDPLYFSRVFKKQTGRAPRAWKSTGSSDPRPDSTVAGSRLYW